MKTIRLFVLVAMFSGLLGATPAYATDCSNPKQSCGGCTINWQISTEDPRPVICYA